MEIKVLGVGCARCKQLYEEAEKAIRQSGVEARLTKVEKLDEIMTHRVLMTPALVINGEVKAAGRIPGLAELASWLTAAAAKEQT